MILLTFWGSKWSIALLVAIGAIVLLYLFGGKSVRAEVEISASPEQIWVVLTDLEEMQHWNSVLVPIAGDLKEGNEVKYRFYQEEGGKPSTINARVRKVVPNININQFGGIPGVLTFDHNYFIENTGDRTTVTIHESYRGIMVSFWNPKPVEQAYQRLLNALSDRVHTINNVQQ